MKTETAQAAALIRKEIKSAFPKLPFACSSKNYAGGNSVTVSLDGATDEIIAIVERIVAKYRRGNFDGMTDSYEYNNRRDIPQANYVFVNNYRHTAAA